MRSWVHLLLLCVGVTYLVFLLVSQLYISRGSVTLNNNEVSSLHEEAASSFSFTFNSSQYEDFEAVEVLTASGISFQERMTAHAELSKPPKLILSWDGGRQWGANLGGCPDWHCQFTLNLSRADEADVVLLSHGLSFVRRNSAQYLVYVAQESPKNSGASVLYKDYFNTSLGYRHDTPTSSPYGYTVKLAKERRLEDVVDIPRLKKKTIAAAWFVSHCKTPSKREELVAALQKFIPVDVYGRCPGAADCPHRGKCENMLNTDYFFYMALENSVCTDYITEKVWNHGYGKDVVPIVLKRSIVDGRLPPHSFLAVDDYGTVEDMASHMHSLMKNASAYLEYFDWRRRYKTIFLNGAVHDDLEKPWGVCQACRLAWENPRKAHVIKDYFPWWFGSCEPDGQTVNRILSKK